MTRPGVLGVLVLITVSCAGSTARPDPRPAISTARSGHGDVRRRSRPSAPALVFGEDVLARALAQNAADVAGPPHTFRAIPVTRIDLSTIHVMKSDGRFRVALPSRAPIVTPTVYDDLVVVSGGFRSHQMYAFRAAIGDPVWGVELGDDGPSMPACEDDVCVFNTESCTIFAVDAHTGALLWSWYLGDPLMSAPAIANGLVFTSYPAQATTEAGKNPPPGGVTHALAAFRLRTGELVWTRWIDADVISAPMAVADAVYASTFAGTIYKLDQRTGAFLEARDAHATSALSFVDGALFYATRSDDVAEVRDARGNRREERRVQERLVRSQKGADAERGPGRNMQQSRAMPADQLHYDFYDGTVQAATSSANDAANGFTGGAPEAANARVARMLVGRASVHGLQEFQGAWVLPWGDANYAIMGASLISFERDNSRMRWSRALPGELASLGILAAPPAAAGGALVVPTTTGQVLLVDPRRGEVRRRFTVGAPLRTQAVVHRGWIYVGTGTGDLVGIDTGNARLTGWPTWAGDAARTGAPR